MILEEGERLEDLECQGLKIIQNKNYYTFTSDSVILANFIKIKRNEKCVEIGCGCGVISILLTAKNEALDITAFEIQENMANLAKKNVKLNKLEGIVKVVHDDVKNFEEYLGSGSVDVVFSNPPYMHSLKEGNANETRNYARHDELLKIDELCLVASKMLKNGGRFYVVYAASRSCELIANLMKCSLEPKRMFFTQNGKGEVKLVVIEAVKGGKHGVNVLPELVTNEESGDYLEKLHTKYFN